MSDSIPFILAGQRQWRAETLPVTDPYDGGLVARVSVPGGADVEEAVAAAQAARRDGADLSSATRAAALGHISQRLAQRRDEVTDLIVREAGKPWKWAAAEAERAVPTLRQPDPPEEATRPSSPCGRPRFAQRSFSNTAFTCPFFTALASAA